MNLTFSRELTQNSTGLTKKPGKRLRLYRAFDEKGEIAGQFFYNQDKQLFKIADKEIRIEAIKKIFKETKHLLIDNFTGEQLVNIQIASTGINFFWKDLPTQPNAVIISDDRTFYFRRILPDVNPSFITVKSRQLYKFRMYDIKGEGFAEYSLEIDIPASFKPFDFSSKPFTGTIETNIENILLLLVPFFLFELEFYFESDNR